MLIPRRSGIHYCGAAKAKLKPPLFHYPLTSNFWVLLVSQPVLQVKQRSAHPEEARRYGRLGAAFGNPRRQSPGNGQRRFFRFRAVVLGRQKARLGAAGFVRVPATAALLLFLLLSPTAAAAAVVGIVVDELERRTSTEHRVSDQCRNERLRNGKYGFRISIVQRKSEVRNCHGHGG